METSHIPKTAAWQERGADQEYVLGKSDFYLHHVESLGFWVSVHQLESLYQLFQVWVLQNKQFLSVKQTKQNSDHSKECKNML